MEIDSIGSGFVETGCTANHRNGPSVRIWEDAWLPSGSSMLLSHRPASCGLVYVSDLMLPGTRTWNEPLVRELLLPMEAEVVLNIPLCLYDREDGWAWSFTPNGRFTVNSAYQVASRHLIEKHTASSLDSETRSLLWNMNVPSKIRIFLWRACREILPATDSLRKRNLNVSEGCRGCSAPTESAFHAICDCPMVRAIWDTGPIKLPQGWENCASFADLFAMVSKSLTANAMCIFVYQCWLCWNNRNAKVFEKEPLTTQQNSAESPFSGDGV